ncbi:putative integral membrane protein [Lasiosphaeria ovina]|uniref:Integral membrane protein n=1 Tax=Lasiosphaeria ovina TaxID=92902 RepID=A0AAE0NL70_9PEZI|nr:putative integral membrane protein [Lasiosphaeria ovina]
MTLEYIDPSANPDGVVINVVVWILLVFAGIFVGLRCYCKLSRRRRLWWDDYLLALSWVIILLAPSLVLSVNTSPADRDKIFLAASCAATSSNIRLGFGLHIYDVPLSNLITIGIVSNVSGFTSVLSLDLSKTSFGITLFRLTDGWLRWLVLAVIIILNITQLTSVLFFWASCDPPAKIWNPQLPGTCWPPKLSVVVGNVAGALSALFDVVLALIPWKILFRFRMYGREKVGVAISMSMGVFAGIACIVKLTTLPLLEKGDFTYYGKPLVLWGFTEASLTIVAASIPFLRSLCPTPARTQELPSLEVPTANRHSETANAAHGGRPHAYSKL